MILTDDQVKLSHNNDLVAMVTIFNPSRSHVDWREFCIQLRSVNVNFGMVEVTGLEIIASRSLSVARPPCLI
jgi:hypothetical protein